MNLKFSSNLSEIEKKIFELKDNDYEIFENDNDYVLYQIKIKLKKYQIYQIMRLETNY